MQSVRSQTASQHWINIVFPSESSLWLILKFQCKINVESPLPYRWKPDVINVDGNNIGTTLIYSYLYDWLSIDIWFTGRSLNVLKSHWFIVDRETTLLLKSHRHIVDREIWLKMHRYIVDREIWLKIHRFLVDRKINTNVLHRTQLISGPWHKRTGKLA